MDTIRRADWYKDMKEPDVKLSQPSDEQMRSDVRLLQLIHRVAAETLPGFHSHWLKTVKYHRNTSKQRNQVITLKIIHGYISYLCCILKSITSCAFKKSVFKNWISISSELKIFSFYQVLFRTLTCWNHETFEIYRFWLTKVLLWSSVLLSCGGFHVPVSQTHLCLQVKVEF